MAGFSVIDVDIGKAAPLVGIAAIGVAIWYIWNKSQQQQQANAAAVQASPVAMYQQAADLALLQSLSGSTPAQGSAGAQSAAPQTNPALPTYSAPGNATQNFTASALGSGTLAASTTSNGI